MLPVSTKIKSKHKGWLFRNENELNTAEDVWKKRWCILDHYKLDVYHNTKATEPLGSYALASIGELSFGGKSGRPFVFSFKTTEGFVNLSAESEEEENKWLQMLREAVPIAKIEATQYQEAISTLRRDSDRLFVRSTFQPYISNFLTCLAKLSTEIDKVTKEGLPKVKTVSTQVTLTVDAANCALAKLSGRDIPNRETVQEVILSSLRIIILDTEALLVYAKNLLFEPEIKQKAISMATKIFNGIEKLMEFLNSIPSLMATQRKWRKITRHQIGLSPYRRKPTQEETDEPIEPIEDDDDEEFVAVVENLNSIHVPLRATAIVL
eukprot:TRINITY_DN5419_c0_g1_i1.p1 TRINITY_DN5419_c0_g1~~TRINITY_DN5419_c0_g1_i1.p1  ORF type:complete len:323 (-),score=59.69 TRINITY_DN5419_c0_g1_i1:178-1146(-)